MSITQGSRTSKIFWKYLYFNNSEYRKGISIYERGYKNGDDTFFDEEDKIDILMKLNDYKKTIEGRIGNKIEISFKENGDVIIIDIPKYRAVKEIF